MAQLGLLRVEKDWDHKTGTEISKSVYGDGVGEGGWTLSKIVKEGLTQAARYFRGEVVKTMRRKISMANFKTPRGRSRKQSKFHIRSGENELVKIHKTTNASETWVKIYLNTKTGIHWFEKGSGTGHWSRTYSDRINPFSKKGRKLGRPRKFGADAYKPIASSADKVRLTRRKTKTGKQRHTGRIEGLDFFKETRENSAIENQITQIVNSHIDKGLSKIL